MLSKAMTMRLQMLYEERDRYCSLGRWTAWCPLANPREALAAWIHLADIMHFLANVNSSSGSLYVVVRPSVVCLSSVVCDVRAPYSGDWNFRQCFYAIWYLGHPWPLCKNFTEIVPGELLHLGLNARGVAKYSDFGPIGRYISETVQDRG